MPSLSDLAPKVSLYETMALVVHLMGPGYVSLLLVGLLSVVIEAGVAPVPPFWLDVTDSVDAGLTWLRNTRIYSDARVAPPAKGLALRVLLEKRAAANVRGSILGYAAAGPADQALARSTVQAILNNATYGVARGGCSRDEGFRAYSDGQNMSALSLYTSTGGPNIDNVCHFTLRSAIDRLVTRTLGAQSRTGDSSGFWGYTGGGDLSGTTLFAASGLAAAREYYLKVDTPPRTDPVAAAQVTAITEALSRTARSYASSQNADGGEGDLVNGDRFSTEGASSYQQTAAGLWASLLGGMGLNTSSVQGFLKWQYQNYNYQTVYAAFGTGEHSYYFSLWASSMAYTILEERGLAPEVGYVGTHDPGTLPAGPIRLDRVGDRLAARNPAADFDARVAFVGEAHHPGKYNGEKSGWCYDYVHTLMTQQLATGQFEDNQRDSRATVSLTDGIWDPYIDHAYAMLVLERASSHCR